MNDWLQKNWWTLVVTALTVVSTYSIYGYRISSLEQSVATQNIAIAALNTTAVQTQVSLARIETDLSYIKIAINKLTQ